MVDPTAIITGVAGPILQVAGREVKNRADYIINYKDNIKRFNDLYEELKARQKDILKTVEEDEMKYNRVASEYVKKWLSDTERFLSDLKSDHEVLLMDDEDRKRIGKSLMGFWNPKKLHDFSRMAQKKADQIDQLLKKVSDLGFNRFTHSSGPPRLDMFQGKFCVGLESRLKILQTIMNVLKSDTNKVNRIGIFGMGGAGKTTLVEEIACQVDRENFFAKVIIVEITRSPNIKLIQDSIANRIGLNLKQVQSEKERALKLNERLKRMRQLKPIKTSDHEQESNSFKEPKLLIILDNLWDRFEMQNLGISYELQMDLECKIIMVSRKKDVCQQMGASDYIYEVGDLNDFEAKVLFQEKVGKNVAQIEEYKVIMEDILKKCSRLPLSISVIADRLRNQNVDVWMHVVQQLDKSNSSKTISILYSTYSILEMSYNSIYSEEQKMFFLLCCIFHYGERILFWNLLDYSIGLGLFQNLSSLDKVIDQAREWIVNLISSSLLLAFDSDNGEIKIHDDIREGGIFIIKKGKQPFHVGDCSSWMLEDSFKKYSIISLLSSNNCKYISGLHLPRLQLLRICKTNISNPHGNYFQRMHNIKVLDLSTSTIENFPSAEGTMHSLRTLLLDDCSSLINISQLCKSVKLQVLSLKRSNIEQLPEEIGNLRNLKLLYLTSSSKLKKIPAGTLAKLSHLEGLFMKDSFKDWESEKGDNFKDCQSAKGMASISELKLLSLKVLEVDVRSIKDLPDDEFFSNLSVFGIRIGERFKSIDTNSGLESVQTSSLHDILFSSRLYIVGGNESDIKRKKGLVALMEKAKTLWLENIDGLTKIVSAFDGYRLSNLKALTVFRCKEMNCVVKGYETNDPKTSSNQGGMYDIFPNLEDLTLCELPQLRSYIFPTQVARKLKVIKLVECKSLKSIFFANSAYMNLHKAERSENNKIEFSSLQKLEMKGLNLLEKFCCETEDTSNANQLLFDKKIKLPRLEVLLLFGIHKIKHVWDDYEKTGKDNCDIPNLKELKIFNCESIESLGSISWILGLQNLYIERCPNMTQVLSSKILGSEDEIICNTPMSFSNLSNLELRDIKSLRCFYQGSSKLNFPLLEKLSLYRLQNIKFFAKYERSIPTKEHEDKAGTITLFSSKKLSFPSLAELNISELDNIEMLWDKVDLEEFSRLNAIVIRSMPKLKRISSEVSDQNRLVGRLKRIHVRSCNSIESLICSQLPPPQSHSPDVNIIVISNLQQLRLFNQKYFQWIGQESLSINFQALHELTLINLDLDDVLDEQEKSSTNQMGAEIEGQREGNGRSCSVNVSLFKKVEFPSLEKLILSGPLMIQKRYRASNSTMIRLEYLPQNMLQNLTYLSLDMLDMRCLFPTKSIPALQKLEELHVKRCYSLEDFFCGVNDEEDHEHGAVERLQLSSLRILRLYFLPKLKQLPCQIFPSLQKLFVYECNPMEAIFGGKEDNDEEATTDDRERISKATEVVVQYMIEFLLLESIEINDMWSLRTLFATSAGKSSYDLQLPSLKLVKIWKCYNMESFSSRTPIAPNLASIEINGEQIDVEDCAGDLNSAVQCKFNERQKVVSNWPKKLRYRSHDQHELILMAIPGFKCHTCQSLMYGEFGFGCMACEFYICGRCGLGSILESNGKEQPVEELPNEIKVAIKWPKTLNLDVHHHQLKLHTVTKVVPTSYFVPLPVKEEIRRLLIEKCDRCKGKISDLFAYFCEKDCSFSLHRKCALEEDHQVTKMSGRIVDDNGGPSDSVVVKPLEMASPELSPLSVSEFTDPCSSTVPTSASETLRVPLFIGGEFIQSQSSQFIDVINPATQEIVSKVPIATTDEFNETILAAKNAFSSWRNTSIDHRKNIILKLRDLIRKNLDEVAYKITIEQGKILKDSYDELYHGIEVLGHVLHMLEFELSESRESLGVCVGIYSTNLPFTVLLWMCLTAIACGNTFVLKSSLNEPGAALLLAKLVVKAELPAGVFNIIQGFDDMINEICDDDDIRTITFIGLSIVGKQIYRKATPKRKSVLWDTPTKSHAIVMPDANIDATLKAIIKAGFGVASHRIMKISSIIFVGNSVKWESMLVEAAKQLNVGIGTKNNVDLGPLISIQEKERICKLIQSAVEARARLLIDGRQIVVEGYEQGNFIGPTIITNIKTHMKCYKKEMSGPILLCIQVENLEDAIEIVNDNDRVTGVTIFTTCEDSIRKFQTQAEVEKVGINELIPVPLPFSSFIEKKTSSTNDLNLHGKFAAEFYTQPKTTIQ